MRQVTLRRWIIFTSLAILLSATSYFVLLGVRTVGHLNEFRSSLQTAAASTEETSSKALDLSNDVEDLFFALGFPGLKQFLHFLNLDLTPIRTEINSIINASPFLLGSDSTKRYLVAFQNSAEARGTGGIIGAFAVIEFDKGKLSIIRTGSNSELKWLEEIPIKMPADFVNLYGSDPAIWVNSNISPHFPYGAEIWLALWKLQFKESLDGVIAVDPSALSYVLKSTGAIVLKSGETINSENVVSETLEKAYKTYEFDNRARKQLLVKIIDATAEKIEKGEYSKVDMARALMRGIQENRILVYSKKAAAQERILGTRLGGSLDSKKGNEFRTVIINTDASKLDYYLERKTVIRSISCGPDAKVEVRVKLFNSLKSAAGLPAYVLTRADKTKPVGLVPGQHRFLAFIYGPTSTDLIEARRSSDFGSPGGMARERFRPLLAVDVDLAPGRSEEIWAIFNRGIGPITYFSQPLVSPEEVTIEDKC